MVAQPTYNCSVASGAMTYVNYTGEHNRCRSMRAGASVCSALQQARPTAVLFDEPCQRAVLTLPRFKDGFRGHSQHVCCFQVLFPLWELLYDCDSAILRPAKMSAFVTLQAAAVMPSGATAATTCSPRPTRRRMDGIWEPAPAPPP